MSTNVSNRSEFTIDRDGTKSWTLNGEYHRLDGPAVVESNGHQAWLIRGKTYHKNKDFQRDAGLSDEDMAILVLKYGNIT